MNGIDRENGGRRVRLCLKTYLDSRGISRYALAQATGIGYPTIDRYYKNEVVRYDADVLTRVVNALDCGIEVILELADDS